MTARSFVCVRNLRRDFVTSKPWLARMLGKGGRETLTAVDDVSFDIAQGEIFALVGESGSGKSTLARLVVGLLPPTGGMVEIDGVAITGPAALRRRGRPHLQMIFQNPFASLNPRWRVGRIVAEPIRAYGLARGGRAVAARVDELLTLVGLHPDHAGGYPHAFSGGQRQRIAIARVLAAEPDFLVCDEPTAALDALVQAQVLDLLRALRDRFGLTSPFITHNLAVARHMATRIGVMRDGRLVEVGGRELFSAPRHPYTRTLLDAVPDAGRTASARVHPGRGCG
jgi:peptide/nickel transport system ATP-binding protein